MKKYLFALIGLFMMLASIDDVVFNPYLFDIDTINAYQNMFDGVKNRI